MDNDFFGIEDLLDQWAEQDCMENMYYETILGVAQRDAARVLCTSLLGRGLVCPRIANN